MRYWANSGLSLKRPGSLYHGTLGGPELSCWREHRKRAHGMALRIQGRKEGSSLPRIPVSLLMTPIPVSADIGDPKRD